MALRCRGLVMAPEAATVNAIEGLKRRIRSPPFAMCPLRCISTRIASLGRLAAAKAGRDLAGLRRAAAGLMSDDFWTLVCHATGFTSLLDAISAGLLDRNLLRERRTVLEDSRLPSRLSE